MEVVASLSQGRTAAAQCCLFTHKSVPVIFEPPCILGITAQSKHGTQYPHLPSAIRPVAHSALVARLQTAWGVGMKN